MRNTLDGTAARESGVGSVPFELSRLADYDEAAMLAEIRRVASATPRESPLTSRLFDQHSKAHSSTIRRHFGSWQKALEAAGVGERYSGRTVGDKAHTQVARGASDADLIREMQRVARELGSETLTQPQFNAHSEMSASAPTRRFGSWKAALSAADLKPVVMGRRYSDADYFENLLSVWTHYGRQPKYGEMNRPPSTITAGGYEKRFGGWTKALVAFVEYANADSEPTQPTSNPSTTSSPAPPERARQAKPSEQRKIGLGLRYDVLRRDHFKCVLCGNSPATDPLCKLHVDHIKAFSRGGKTVPENLRTTCDACNIGKSDKVEVRPTKAST